MKDKKEKPPEPKIQFSFDGCYKYNKLKKKGLLDEDYVRKLTDHNDGS